MKYAQKDAAHDLDFVREVLNQYTCSIVKGLGKRAESPLFKGSIADIPVSGEVPTYNEFSSNLYAEKVVGFQKQINKEVNLRKIVADSYIRTLSQLCRNKEAADHNYLIDQDRVMLEYIYKRLSLAGYVAQIKINQPGLDGLVGREELRPKIENYDREGKVISDAIDIAGKNGIEEEPIANFFKEIIELTKDLEIIYILEMAKKEGKSFEKILVPSIHNADLKKYVLKKYFNSQKSLPQPSMRFP
ncbi:MAG: chorismate mutase [Nanoarchaeota archaeon]|nr:chorismate mutase [Nanoarchaeota archaeon]